MDMKEQLGELVKKIEEARIDEKLKNGVEAVRSKIEEEKIDEKLKSGIEAVKEKLASSAINEKLEDIKNKFNGTTKDR